MAAQRLRVVEDRLRQLILILGRRVVVRERHRVALVVQVDNIHTGAEVRSGSKLILGRV
jgi:hypothetical protein